MLHITIYQPHPIQHSAEHTLRCIIRRSFSIYTNIKKYCRSITVIRKIKDDDDVYLLVLKSFLNCA